MFLNEIGAVWGIFGVLGCKRERALPTRCRLPVTKACIPLSWSPTLLARFRAPSMVGSMEILAPGSVLFQASIYCCRRFGEKSVLSFLKLLHVFIIVSSCFSLYVLKMTCCNRIPPSCKDLEIHFRRAAPSRFERWLKIRTRVRGGVLLDTSVSGFRYWIRHYQVPLNFQ